MRKSVQGMIIKARCCMLSSNFTPSPKCARNKLTNLQAQIFGGLLTRITKFTMCTSMYESLIMEADEFEAGCRPLRVKNLCQLWKMWSFSCQQNDGGRSTTTLQIRRGEVLMQEKPTNQPTSQAWPVKVLKEISYVITWIYCLAHDSKWISKFFSPWWWPGERVLISAVVQVTGNTRRRGLRVLKALDWDSPQSCCVMLLTPGDLLPFSYHFPQVTRLTFSLLLKFTLVGGCKRPAWTRRWATTGCRKKKTLEGLEFPFWRA